MMIASMLRHVCVFVCLLPLIACGGKSGGGGGEKRPIPTGRDQVAGEEFVEARLVLSLVESDAQVVTDEQAMSVLRARCASCHASNAPARLDLTVVPAVEQSAEIKRRILLAIDAPGHMPIGSALAMGELGRLSAWLDRRVANVADPFAGTRVEVNGFGAANAVGQGRYQIGLGKLPVDKPVAIAVRMTGKDGVMRTARFNVAQLPRDGVVYKTLVLAKGTGERIIEITEPSHGDGAADAGDGGGSGGIDGIDRDGAGDDDVRVDAFLDVRLRTSGSAQIADDAALSILRLECQACHNAANSPRWDLTTLPARERMSEIARRVNLAPAALGHMPLGRSLGEGDLATLNQWLVEQQSPGDEFAGYALQATENGVDVGLGASRLDHGRSRVDLGRRTPGDVLTVSLAVTGADGIAEIKTLTVTVGASGSASAEIDVAARDVKAPALVDRKLKVSGLTASGATVTFGAATDDRPAAHLTYTVYAYAGDGAFDSVDDVLANGAKIGGDLAASALLAAQATDLAPETTYRFNVIVRDRTGNASVYEALDVLTLPTTLCNEVAQAGSVQLWRDDLATQLDAGTLSGKDAAKQIRQCFPQKVPQCAQRALAYAEKNDVAPGGSDGTIATMPQKRPPDEIRDLAGGEGKYWIPDDIEQIAAAKGWTAVRYKSRHAGGFDSDTPNLLMVYVPGDKVSPPVKFDRWLNFPLPKDDDEPALGLPQHPRPKFGPPARAAYDQPNNFPSTFTMVSQDRAENGKPAVVYFQMFSRGSGASFTPSGAVSVGGCVSCHPNGLRAIAPLGYDVRAGEERLADEDWKKVEIINRAMVEGAGFKAATWGEGVSQGVKKPLYRAERGPSMGPAKPLNKISRTKQFIMGGVLDGQQLQGCFARNTRIDVTDIFQRAPGMYQPTNVFRLSATPDIDPDKVIAAMGSCEGCHTRGQRHPLGEDTSYSQVQFKILVDQSMPLGWHQNPLDAGNDTGEVVDRLTADERFALANCLEAEFELEQELVKEWMTEDACQQ